MKKEENLIPLTRFGRIIGTSYYLQIGKEGDKFYVLVQKGEYRLGVFTFETLDYNRIINWGIQIFDKPYVDPYQVRRTITILLERTIVKLRELEKKKEMERALMEYHKAAISTLEHNGKDWEDFKDLVDEKRNVFYQKQKECEALLKEELGEEGYQEYQENLKKKEEEWRKSIKASKKEEEGMPKIVIFIVIIIIISIILSFFGITFWI